MNTKRKIVMLALLLTLVLSPLFAGMLMAGYNPITVNEAGIVPTKSYGMSANPSITSAPIVTNPTTTDNLYGGNYAAYLITVNITNTVAVAGIGAITVTLNTTTAIVCGMQYSNVTHVWTEHATNPTYITGTGTNCSDANDINATLTFYIDWLFSDTNDLYVFCKVFNATGTGSFTSQSAGTYDIDTDLSLTTDNFITDAQVEQNSIMGVETLTYSYEDSAAAVHPLAAQTDFYVGRAASTDVDSTYDAQYWEADSYSDSTGIATWTTAILAKGGAHTETFSMFAVKQSDGSTGTTVMGTDGSDTVSVLDHPPADDDDDGILPGIDWTSPEVVNTMILVGGIIVVGGVIYAMKSSISMMGAGRRGLSMHKRRKTTRRKNTSKRRKR